jgi:hypothetical protein
MQEMRPNNLATEHICPYCRYLYVVPIPQQSCVVQCPGCDRSFPIPTPVVAMDGNSERAAVGAAPTKEPKADLPVKNEISSGSPIPTNDATGSPAPTTEVLTADSSILNAGKSLADKAITSANSEAEKAKRESAEGERARNTGLNKHGLSRGIPEGIKRLVRQRCRFGCVVCGRAVYHYDHFDPEFEEAKEHNPAGITLLCGSCHDKKTRGLLSTETVRQWNRNPKCLHTGFSFEAFDVGGQHPRIFIANNQIHFARRVIYAAELTRNGLNYKETLFGIEKSEEPGGPFRLNANFSLEDAPEYFRIEQNEWQTSSGNWDVEVKGQRIIVRRGSGDIVLELRSEPPHSVFLEKIELYYKPFNAHIRGDWKGLSVSMPGRNNLIMSNNISYGGGFCLLPEGWAF